MSSLNLKVEIDNKSGFCFGVIYTIEIAEYYLNNYGKLYCLGDIVHNDIEIKRLEKKGLKTIGHNEFRKLKNKRILLRAHGEPPETYKIAFQNNNQLIDASCPVVLHLQNKTKKLNDSNPAQVLIFGKPGHAEIIGLIGQTQGDAKVFQNIDELKRMQLPSRVILISQTTRDPAQLHQARAYLIEQGIEVEFYNTICGQVANRNRKLKVFVQGKDKVLFVADRKSSNGQVLFEICKRYNSDTFLISKMSDLNINWFNKGDKVGISGATSTPGWLMEQIKDSLEKM